MRVTSSISFLTIVLVASLAASAAPTLTRPASDHREAAFPATPADRFGKFYAAVQERRIFPDSKTFADAIARDTDAAIMARWRDIPKLNDAALRRLVLDNFILPPSPTSPEQDRERPPIADHIRMLWPRLSRTSIRTESGGSAIALPKPYVVPGGRFRELYYWDSYFTMLGLVRSGRQDLVETMIADFGSLIDRFGHIPNGTRSYYLSRSQPPVFYLMAELSKQRSRFALVRRLRWMRAEHRYWMAGERGLRPGMQHRRVVRLPDGSLLNRYWDDRATPRDESWREDVALAESVPERPAPDVYRDIRAAAESGWDFSSRWLGDRRSLSTIRTTRVVPIDLNSLLYGMERAIAHDCRIVGDRPCAAAFENRALQRRAAINLHLWNTRFAIYADYDLDARRASPEPTAAMSFPLFAGIASPIQAQYTARALKPLIGMGGLATTRRSTGQQWDAPNGWAPLQWISVSGLCRYQHSALAKRIATNWQRSVMREYRSSGRLLEKYDVLEVRPGGGGEYPLQDGFGWTNGVYLALTVIMSRTDACSSLPNLR